MSLFDHQSTDQVLDPIELDGKFLEWMADVVQLIVTRFLTGIFLVDWIPMAMMCTSCICEPSASFFKDAAVITAVLVYIGMQHFIVIPSAAQLKATHDEIARINAKRYSNMIHMLDLGNSLLHVKQDVRNAQRTERNLKRKIQTVDLENGDLELMRLKYEDFFALAKGQIGKILQAATNMSHKKKKLQCFKEAMLMSYEDRNADPRHADMIGKKAANIINVGESVKVDMIMPGNGMNTGDDSINVGNTTNMKPEDGMIATPPRIARVGDYVSVMDGDNVSPAPGQGMLTANDGSAATLICHTVLSPVSSCSTIDVSTCKSPLTAAVTSTTLSFNFASQERKTKRTKSQRKQAKKWALKRASRLPAGTPTFSFA